MAGQHKLQDDPLDGAVTFLLEIPFVKSARLIRDGRDAGPRKPADARLVVRTSVREHRLKVHVKKGILSRAVVDRLVHDVRKEIGQSILVTSLVTRPLGRYLAERGFNFVDEHGNYRLRLGDRFLAQSEGRPARNRAPAAKGTRAAGYQVLFALLASPELVRKPVRTIAQAAGASRQAVLDALRRLESKGAVTGTGPYRVWVPGRSGGELDRWLVGYTDVVRPKLRRAVWRVPEESSDAREEKLRRILADRVLWRWGGVTAAWRLTRHYRSNRTVIHVENPPADLRKGLRALPDEDGQLLLLGFPGPFGVTGATPDTVHPLLAYSELLADDDERAREAAQDLFENYVHLP